MDQITRINHVGIRVRDLAATRAFYEKLGFAFLVGPVGPEPVAIMEHPSGVNLNFILNAAPEAAANVLMDVPVKHPGYTHMALEVTDIAAVQARLVELGIPLSGGPVVVNNGATLIFVRDPDANVIEFHQPA
ncbi:MAG: VOC family protein [Alphaproteobacteria bacterium]